MAGFEREVNDRLDAIELSNRQILNLLSGGTADFYFKTQLYNHNGNSLSIDECGAGQTIDIRHKKVHEGLYWQWFHYTASLANNATLGWVIKTGSREFHFTAVLSKTGTFLKEIYINPVYTGGVLIPAINLNSNSIYTNTTTAYSGATVTNNGTLVASAYDLGGTTPTTRVATNNIAQTETVWGENLTFLALVTNKSGTSCEVAIDLQGYEEECE